MQRVLEAAAQNPLMIPPDLMSYILDYIQTSRLIIPIGQVFGFAQFTAQIVTDASGVTSSSTSYGDPVGTAGPLLDGLPSGNYVVAHGAVSKNNTSSDNALVSVQVNGTAADDVDATFATVTEYVSVSRMNLKNLPNPSNSLSLKYRVTGGTGSYQNRWLLALKYSN
jgi:hypothetical protein